jgi:hypothetical protein
MTHAYTIPATDADLADLPSYRAGVLVGCAVDGCGRLRDDAHAHTDAGDRTRPAIAKLPPFSPFTRLALAGLLPAKELGR